MVYEKRHTGLFGVAGVLVAALIIAGFVFAGNIVFGKSILRIEVMDAPVELDHLFLTIDGVQIQDTEEKWIDLDLTSAGGSLSFDLLALKDVSLTVSQTTIDPGSYRVVRLHISTASAESEGGTDLRVPSDILKVYFDPQLTLEPNGDTTVLIDLEPVDITSIATSHSLNLRPVIKSVITQPSA